MGRARPAVNSAGSRFENDRIRRKISVRANSTIVRISITADEIARLNGLKVVPGMAVEGCIPTEERTMSCLLMPLTDQGQSDVPKK